MPLLVTRQWPVLRRAAAATRTLRCSSNTSNKWRGSDQLRTSHSASSLAPSLHRGIIVPKSVETHPHELVKHIVPPELGDALQKTFCVFFVTPSYAQYLLDDDAFLRKALLRAYRKASHQEDLYIHALCAVVDKLPIRRVLQGFRKTEEELSRRATEPPVAGTGVEGIAYALLPPDASVSSQELSPSDKGAIDFIFAEHDFKDTVYRDTLRLPLANTVFQTGTPSTMILSTWKTLGVNRELTPVSKTDISHHGIRLIERQDSSHLPPILNVPLIPLTMPRIVEGCMGNIIRGVIGPEDKTMQASSELENVVPRFFRSRGQPAQATVAWALVIPGELKAVIAARTDELLTGLPTDNEGTASKQEDTWERLWRSDPPLWNTLVSKALTEGARLHRVLSGGGGWGKKAGLLSLDPVPANQAAESSKDNDFLGMINDPEDFESTLTPVVRDGDSIQFFISPKSDLEQLAQNSGSLKSVKSLAGTAAGRPWGWELGTVPSTIDSIPGEFWQHRPSESGRVSTFHGFGALTEGPMTLTQHSQMEGNKASTVNITTIDVPFSRLSASVNAARLRGKNDDSIHEPNTLKSLPSISAQSPTNSRPTLQAATLSSSQQKRGFRHASIPKALPTVREFSSTATFKEPPRSPPKLTVSELVRKLKIEGHPTSGRLRVRTAKAVLRRFEKLFDKQNMQHKTVMSAIRQRDCRLMVVRYRTIMVEVADLTEEAESVLHDIHHRPVRRISSKERGKSKRETLERNAENREKKTAQSTSRKEKLARKEDTTQLVSPTTAGVPIRKFLSFGMSTSGEINRKLQSGVSEVSHLTEEARVIMATVQQYRPRIRRMPVSKLATSQALNQTLGYAVQEILHLTEEARGIMATIQQRKRQSSWRFIRRWGRDATSIPLRPDSSPTGLLVWARRNLRAWRLGIKYLKKEVNVIGTLIRQRKRTYRKSVNGEPRIIKDQRLRVRRVRPHDIRVVRHSSQPWVVRKKPFHRKSVITVRKTPSNLESRLSRLRQPITEKKRKRDELALTVESWLKRGGGYGHG